MSTITLYRHPIGIIFYLFVIHNWIGDHYSDEFPIISQVCLGKTFTWDPKSNITSFISILWSVHSISFLDQKFSYFCLLYALCIVQGVTYPCQCSCLLTFVVATLLSGPLRASCGFVWRISILRDLSPTQQWPPQASLFVHFGSLMWKLLNPQRSSSPP